jgi:uncharacterized protein (DUF58 family)
MIASFRQTPMPATQPGATHNESPPTSDTGDGLVRIGLPSLIALRHAAESLPLKAKRVLSPGSGNYRSPFKGRGMEFAEVRPYMQGDDARTLDWRVTARTGRPHTKLFREERERAVLLWIDLRQPMFFATQGAFKAVRAAQAAALLGWSAIAQEDRIGGLVFSESAHIELGPKRGKAALLHLLSQIADHPTWQRSAPANNASAGIDALNQSLARLRRVAQPGSLICLLSDFSGLNAQSTAHLVQLARHSDVLLIGIHDPLEANLPPPGHYRIGDGERFLTVMAEDNNLRSRYRERFISQQEALRQLCRRHRMNWVPLVTAEDPLGVLQRGLGVNT